AAARHAIDVSQPRLAWRGAGARDFLADQRVDQARLADVRASHEGRLWQTIAREVARACGASNKRGFYVQRGGRPGRAGRAGRLLPATPPASPDPPASPAL